MKAVQFTDEDNRIKDFLDLPKKLYPKDENMENPAEVEKILQGTHILSHYFTVNKWVIYDDCDKPAGRFIITEYPDDNNAYLGYYECTDNDDAAKCIFDTAAEFCRSKGYQKIVGPLDASFWIKYRLKISHFTHQPYTGEPYNLEYYFKQFKDNGFEVAEHYTSQMFDVLDDLPENFEARLQKFTDLGYEIVMPKDDEFDKVIPEVFDLMSVLYSDFPMYKPIEKSEFEQIFANYKLIINMRMVRMVYYEGKPVGFYVSFPDYGNLVYHASNPLNIVKILDIKRNPKLYVMMHMGVKPEHQGLGKAMSASICIELVDMKLPSIGALVRDGKVNQKYAPESLITRYEYVLLEKAL